MEVRCREAMAPWLMPMLGLTSGGREDDFDSTPLELGNADALPAWLKPGDQAATRVTQADTV
jgi:hypothetical protein